HLVASSSRSAERATSALVSLGAGHWRKPLILHRHSGPILVDLIDAVSIAVVRSLLTGMRLAPHLRAADLKRRPRLDCVRERLAAIPAGCDCHRVERRPA